MALAQLEPINATVSRGYAYAPADMPDKMFRIKGPTFSNKNVGLAIGHTPSARRLARRRDHHRATPLVGACSLCGIRPLGVEIFLSSIGLAAFTVAMILCTATTGVGGLVDMKRSGRWATVELKECSSACVTATSAANDSMTECRGEPGVFLKMGFPMKGVAGAAGYLDLSFDFGSLRDVISS